MLITTSVTDRNNTCRIFVGLLVKTHKLAHIFDWYCKDCLYQRHSRKLHILRQIIELAISCFLHIFLFYHHFYNLVSYIFIQKCLFQKILPKKFLLYYKTKTNCFYLYAKFSIHISIFVFIFTVCDELLFLFCSLVQSVFSYTLCLKQTENSCCSTKTLLLWSGQWYFGNFLFSRKFSICIWYWLVF